VLVVDKLQPLAENQEYQVWLQRDSTEISGGTFAVDEDGYRGLRIVAPESLLTYTSVEVTIEPAGGSSNPTGPQVLNGSLFNSGTNR
jgi:anti-sigma-K factor RskA